MSLKTKPTSWPHSVST
uniref:Uncharacterized protein n=1 Tax=Anguilla anguilla TaxID=7936 RepID=A0A0E9VR52_ANGAN